MKLPKIRKAPFVTTLEETFGPVIWQNEDYVIRAKVEKNGKLTVYAHVKDDGEECLPRGYIEGSNYLSRSPIYT